jgi:hypothetical protein
MIDVNMGCDQSPDTIQGKIDGEVTGIRTAFWRGFRALK